MGARKQFPEFDDMTAGEFAELLKNCKLSSLEKEVAARYIIWHMSDVEVGAEADRDRRTVARWMEKVILPEIRRVRDRMRYIV